MSKTVMQDLFEKPQRRGGSGRVSDKMAASHVKYAAINITLPNELNERLIKYAQEEERAKSWVIQKALDKWLEERGY